MVDLLRVPGRGVHANQKAISWGQDVGKLFDESDGFIAREIADARAQRQDHFWSACVLWSLQPLEAIIVCPVKAKALHVFGKSLSALAARVLSSSDLMRSRAK